MDKLFQLFTLGRGMTDRFGPRKSPACHWFKILYPIGGNHTGLLDWDLSEKSREIFLHNFHAGHVDQNQKCYKEKP